MQNNRPNKGSNISKYVSDYCILDLETTSNIIVDAKIIEIAAIKVRDNSIVDEFTSFVNPKCHIPSIASSVNHITDDMVADAPVIENIIENIITFIGNDVVIGYNIAGFDINIIYDIVEERGLPPFSNNYIDLLHVSRRCIHDVENHKLETISKYFSLDISGEHRALKDCFLTKACYDRIFKEYGENVFINKYSPKEGSYRSNIISRDKEALDTFEAILNFYETNTHSKYMIRDLETWGVENETLNQEYPFNQLIKLINEIVADDYVSDEEYTKLKQLYIESINPVEKSEKTLSSNELAGKHICITGDFKMGTRDYVIESLEKMGVLVDKTVKKSTDFVLVGSLGSDKWVTGNYGTKIKKAKELNANGANIGLIKEEDILLG